MALQQYYNTVGPIGFGLPQTNVNRTSPQANPLTMAAGGAMTGASMGSMFGNPMMGAAIGGLGGLLGGLL